MKKVLGKISGFFRKIGDFFYNISEKISKKVGKLSNRTREILAGLLFNLFKFLYKSRNWLIEMYWIWF